MIPSPSSRLPPVVRLVLVRVGGGAAVVLAVCALAVGGSMWLESRHVFGPSSSALVERLRSSVTKPIAATVGRQVQLQFQRNRRTSIEAGLRDYGVKANIAGLLDTRLSPQQRGVYAYRLAQAGTPEALAALLRVFQNAPSTYKPFLAQLLGSTGNPRFKEWLLPLLQDPDQKLAAAAMRGLATIGGDDVTAQLAQILSDPSRSQRARLDAASGLALLGTSSACQALIDSFPAFARTDAALELLQTLGQFPYPQIESTFTDLLAAPGTSSPIRVAAVEALAESTSEAVPFLLGLVAHDRDAEVRASAAWALAAQGQAGLGHTLADSLSHEDDVDVRRRIYEALVPQNDLPGQTLLPLVLAETDIAARVAGFNSLASAAAQARSSSLDAVFDGQIIPELERIATSPNSLNIQMRAVFALRRSGSDRALQALGEIARSSDAPGQVSAAAQHGLL